MLIKKFLANVKPEDVNHLSPSCGYRRNLATGVEDEIATVVQKISDDCETWIQNNIKSSILLYHQKMHQ